NRAVREVDVKRAGKARVIDHRTIDIALSRNRINQHRHAARPVPHRQKALVTTSLASQATVGRARHAEPVLPERFVERGADARGMLYAHSTSRRSVAVVAVTWLPVRPTPRR